MSGFVIKLNGHAGITEPSTEGGIGWKDVQGLCLFSLTIMVGVFEA